MYCLEVDGGTPTYTIEGANESSCSTHAITYNTRFICRVTDDYGNSESLWFYVRIDSGLSARAANDGRVSVAPGECAVLRVIASCDSGSLSYQWGRWSSGIIDGATAEAFTTGPITEAIDYYCRVSDDYGNRTYVSIYITIDNRLVAEPVGVSEFTILPGETVNLNLEVNASCALGELTYRWYESGYDEDGDSYYRRISGADTGVYACDGITRTTCIVCEVNDDYGNNESIRFNITCENGLKAVESQTIYVAQGEDAVLTAEAVCDCDDLFYIWYNVDEDDENMGYKGESTYTLTGVEYSDDSIYCQVIDMYGNYAYCHFEVYVENDISAEAEVTVNGLSVEYDGSPITVSAGDDVAITLAGTCEQGEIDYFWDDYEDNFSEGDTFTFTDIQSESYINGFVRDAFGNEVVFFFDFVIENGLTVSPVGDTFLSVSEGEEVTLAVEASADIGDISFRWEKDYTEMDENGPSVTFNASTGGMYTCEATDIYGNTMRTNFVINVGSPQVLIPDEEVFLTLKGGGSACLAFTPGESGDYNIFSSGSNDPIVYLYDGDGRQIGMNDDSGDNYNFSLTAYLNAGETYLYIVRYADAYGSHSFSVMLTRRQADGDVISSGTYVLRSGQTGRLPYSGEHIVSVTSDNSSVVSASGLTITAVRAGTANLTLEWVDGFTATVEIVVKAESALTLPASLSQIESEAFASDRSVRFAELGRGVQRIGPFAFSESGLWQICIPSSDTQIAASAFYGITPTILCKEGSAAAEYAMNHGNPFLYID